VKISIIVPAFNEEQLLPSALAAIHDACHGFWELGWETELIVCDNNSRDQTAQIARAGGARVVFEPVNQIARARNTGAAAATGDWFLFIDADSRPSADLFRAVAQGINSGKYLAGGAALRLDEATRLTRLIARIWILWSRLARHMAGSFIFCEAATFRSLGGFNQELYAGEEIELSSRLKKLARQRGRRLTIIAEPRLVTSGRKTRLYSAREIVTFLIRAAFRPRRILTSRESCSLWYDGRR
jgi:glycosyltransferase involved in cell wall biosynthesis